MRDKIIAKQKELIKLLSEHNPTWSLNEKFARNKLIKELKALESEPASELFEKVYIKSEKDLPSKHNEVQSDWYYLGTRSNQYAVGYYDFYLHKWYSQEFAELNDPDFYLKPLTPEPKDKSK